MAADRRTMFRAVFVLAVLALVTASLVSGPAGATSGAVTNPVVIKAGWANGPAAVPDAMATIRQLSVGVGKWAISAKLFVEGGTYADCSLSAGVDNDTAKAGLYGTSGTITSTLSMQVTHQFSAAGKAIVSCTDQGTGMNWWRLKITAVKGGTLTNVAL